MYYNHAAIKWQQRGIKWLLNGKWWIAKCEWQSWSFGKTCRSFQSPVFSVSKIVKQHRFFAVRTQRSGRENLTIVVVVVVNFGTWVLLLTPLFEIFSGLLSFCLMAQEGRTLRSVPENLTSSKKEKRTDVWQDENYYISFWKTKSNNRFSSYPYLETLVSNKILHILRCKNMV